MTAFRTILVPLDRSEIAEQAIAVAASMARRSGGRLHLVSVEEPLRALALASDSSEIVKEVDEMDRSQLPSYLDTMAAAAREVQGRGVERAVLRGPVPEALSDYADAQAVDLIVMTTRRRHGFSRFLTGSVADQLLRRVHVPILLLHPRDPPWPIAFGRILVALNGDVDEPVLASVAALGLLYPQAHYTLTRVVEPSLPIVTPLSPYPISEGPERMEHREAEARMYLSTVCGKLRDRGLDATYKVLVGAVAPQVLQLAQSVLADCIVVGTHSRRGIGRLVLGSEAERIVHGSTTPVLIAPVREG